MKGSIQTPEQERKKCCGIVACCKSFCVKKNAPKILLLVAIVVVGVLAGVFNRTALRILTSFLEWLQANPGAGALVFVGVYTVGTVMFLPGLILTVGAGFVFSQVLPVVAAVFVATLVVWVGACLGATIAFLLGRFILRDTVEQWAANLNDWEIIKQVIELSGFKVTLLLRLTPVIPFNLLNYIMGLLPVTLRAYVMAHVGMIPGTMAYCFIGTTIGSLASASSVGLASGGGVTLGVVIGGTVLAFIGLFYVGYVAKKEWARLTAQVRGGGEPQGVAADGMDSPMMDKDEDKLSEFPDTGTKAGSAAVHSGGTAETREV